MPPRLNADTRRRMAGTRETSGRIVFVAALMSLLVIAAEAVLLSFVADIRLVLLLAGAQVSLLSLAVSFGLLHRKTREGIFA